MKKGDVEAAMPHLLDEWVERVGEPWPPDGVHHYSFGSFWTWMQNSRYAYLFYEDAELFARFEILAPGPFASLTIGRKIAARLGAS